MRKLEQEVSNVYYCNDDFHCEGVSIERALGTGACEYKSTYDNPPDSSERCIGGMAYMRNEDYEAGINQLIESGNCVILMYEDKSFAKKAGRLEIERKNEKIYVNGLHISLTIDSLLGIGCPRAQTYYK